MSNISSRNEWIFGECKNVLEDKDYMLRAEITKMLNTSVRMFDYKNLPETIQQKDLETYNQVGGFTIWKEVNDNLYVFNGMLGGKPNAYYLPTLAVVANPGLNYNASLEIDKECVVMLNDDYYQGLMPVHNKFASLLVESEISLKYALLNARIPAFIQADNDNTYDSAVNLIDKIYNGKGYGIIGSKEFFDGLRTFQFSQYSYIKDLIEAIQYIKGNWYNAIGLKSSFNMKRESINEAEASLNDDILYPSVDTMLDCRKKGIEKINKMYGTNISVELGSAWKKNRYENELDNKVKEAEISEMESEKNETNRDIDNSAEN